MRNDYIVDVRGHCRAPEQVQPAKLISVPELTAPTCQVDLHMPNEWLRRDWVNEMNLYTLQWTAIAWTNEYELIDNEWVNKLMSQWVKKWMDESMSEQMNEYVNKWAREWMK